MADIATPAAPAAAQATATAVDLAATKGGAAQAGTEIGHGAPAQKPSEIFHEVRVDGKVKKVPLSELLDKYSHADTANKRFEEAAALRKQAEGFLSKLRDPKQALSLLEDPALGLDSKQVREAMEEWYDRKFLKPEAMTPEQRKLAETEAKMKEYESRLEAMAKAKEEEENKRLDAAEAQKVTQEVIALCEKVGLPKTRFTASRIAHWVRVSGLQQWNSPPEAIINRVKQEWRGIMEGGIQNSDGEVLINLLGEDTVKKIRKYDLERIRKSRGQAAPAEAKQDYKPANPNEKISMEEYKRRLREFK
jgi:hypothetical protein